MVALWRDIGPDFERQRVVVFRNVCGYKYFHHVRELDSKHAKDLLGLEPQIEKLDSNTKSFLHSKPASNVLLWGARGMGKSACIKATLIPYLLSDNNPYAMLRVIEISGKDIEILPLVFDHVSILPHFFIIFCDDLVLDKDSVFYGSFKSTLEGSFAKKPNNVLLYVTSNLKHVINENNDSTINLHGGVDEMISLSDRFPLTIGFYPMSQSEYLAVFKKLIYDYLVDSGHDSQQAEIQSSKILESTSKEAINFATKIGNRSPRSAKDFFSVHFNKMFN